MKHQRTGRGSGWWLVAALLPMGIACSWAAGRLAGDQWGWSQLCFWIPAPLAAVCGGLGGACAWRALHGRARAAAACTLAIGAWAALHTAWWCIGWRVGAMPLPLAGADAQSRAVVVHWNARAPGEQAAAFGAALVSAEADIYVISNPGAMLRGENAASWVPAGWHRADAASVAIVSRWPIDLLQVVVQPLGVPSQAAWVAHAVLRDQHGDALRVLVVDLPSDPRLARGWVVAKVKAQLADAAQDFAPDLVVGDFNSIEGSVLFGTCPTAQPPPPWRGLGWLGTFPRHMPLWRIDWMRAAPSLGFDRYETLDFGIGLHRGQRATLHRTPATS